MLKFTRRFASSQLVKAGAPANLTRVVAGKSTYYDIQEYQTSELRQYFKEDALLYPIETIIEKTTLKDFGFFLNNGNFLKVVDTLEKFEEGLLDKDSPRAREFILFKRQLYAMYEVQNRSVNEHELFSFEVERHNLSWLYNANTEFVQEMHRVDQNDQLADYTRLGKDEVFRRRALSPRRFKGLGAFASSWALYSYAPYVAMYFGATIPILGAVCAGLYGMLQFSES